jgi:Lon protease-like protein
MMRCDGLAPVFLGVIRKFRDELLRRLGLLKPKSLELKSGNLDERSSLYGCCGRFTSLSGCRKLRVKILRKTRLGKPIMLK